MSTLDSIRLEALRVQLREGVLDPDGDVAFLLRVVEQDRLHLREHEPKPSLAEMIGAVREVIDDGKPWYRLGLLRAALDDLREHERVVAERDHLKINFERVQRHLQHAIADRDNIRTQTIRECAAIARRFCFMPAVEMREENDAAKIEDEIIALWNRR